MSVPEQYVVGEYEKNNRNDQNKQNNNNQLKYHKHQHSFNRQIYSSNQQ